MVASAVRRDRSLQRWCEIAIHRRSRRIDHSVPYDCFGLWAAVRHNTRMLQHCLSKQTLCQCDCGPLQCQKRTLIPDEIAESVVAGALSSTSSPFCPFRSGVSKPSVNRQQTDASRSRATLGGIYPFAGGVIRASASFSSAATQRSPVC
jgi:hypothetical protein